MPVVQLARGFLVPRAEPLEQLYVDVGLIIAEGIGVPMHSPAFYRKRCAAGPEAESPPCPPMLAVKPNRVPWITRILRTDGGTLRSGSGAAGMPSRRIRLALGWRADNGKT